ncbi:MAG TPA: EAL domain-containing protein [Geomonas sp.]|nr:EAL domain-containing protein [Geomonas sp.]
MEPVSYDIRDIMLLFVEDENEAREMLAKMLRLNYPGLKVLVAENGAVGLELFRQFRPQIVMTDINMPVMNGIVMARRMKDLDPEVTIVAVTAHSDTSYLLGAIEVGIDHYVLKPVNYTDLFAVLDRIIEKIALRRVVAQQLERIRRREQQLSEAQKVTHLGSWEWDAASGQVTASDELYRIFGLPPEAVSPSYLALKERVPEGERESLEKAVQQALQARQMVTSHYFRIVRPDGTLRIVRGQLEVGYDEAGQPLAMIGTCHDVTEQKWSEAALRASEQRFFRIFQATPDLLSITGQADRQYLEVNQAFLKALGYQRTEVIGKDSHELPVWCDQQEREEMEAALTEKGEVRDLEVRLRDRAGRELTGLLSAELIEIEGRPSVLTLFKDISERKRFEEDRARLAAIVEYSDDAIMATDSEGGILSWNAGAEKMLGYWGEEAKGKPLTFLAPQERRDEIHQMGQALKNGEPVGHLESIFLRKDGSQLNVSLTMSAIKGGDGAFAGTSCIARDVTERTRMEETIRHQAQHDALTDLPNRKLFMDFLALELAQARRNRKNIAVLFLDLDHFKQINDTLGHEAGDLLLQAVAHRLRRCVRESDTVARIGGDEFNVLMPDLAQTDDVGTVVGKIMGVFGTPFLLDNLEVRATTSVGVSMFPVDGDSSEELVRKADSAMYVAKQSEGNSYQFYNEEINSRTGRRQTMARLLREAPANGELELLFQPQVRVNGGGIVGAEALLRWHHPDLGLLLPSQFLAVAEETGAIVPIGEWVIQHACAQMKSWHDKGFVFSMTVNLSNKEFHQPNLLEVTSRALADHGLPPQFLELDITESAIMENPNYSIRSMRQLAQLGVGFSVDDFGIGSSSLHWIKQLPIRRVKIDKSFIREIDKEPNDLAVVSAMICMSHNLNMKVNAVGVESAEQLSLVRSHGCDEVQGDLIGKPLPPDEFEQLVANL